MPYVKRDATGKITALSEVASDECPEQASPSDPALLDFLQASGADASPEKRLAASDADLARIVEDLIDLLIEKRLIMFTELPPIAQAKLLNRRRAREMLRDNVGVIVEEDDVL
jgi:hypothetical protein